MGLTAWRPGRLAGGYEVVDGELYEDKRRPQKRRSGWRRRRTAVDPIRILGRSSGRRRWPAAKTVRVRTTWRYSISASSLAFTIASSLE